MRFGCNRSQIAVWKAVADSYRAAVSLDGPLGESTIVAGIGTAAGGSGMRAHGQGVTQLPVGIFRDKGLKEAIQTLPGSRTPEADQ